MMRKLLYLVLLCLPLTAHAQVCGPPDYASPCAISDTAIHPYAPPLNNQWVNASWGPNICDSTSMFTMQLCGNLTGAGTVRVTDDDFHALMTRCTDSTFSTGPADTNPWQHVWQTADEPSVNLWNSDDTGALLLINSGQQWVFLWNGTTCQIMKDSSGNGVSFPAGTVWSYVNNNNIYSVDNVTGPGIQLQKKTVNLVQNCDVAGTPPCVSNANLFDFANSQCLMNAVNGYASDPLHLATVTSWSGTGTTVTFQAVNSLAVGQTVVLSGFAVSTFFNGNSYTVVSPTATQFKITDAHTGTTDTGLATATTFPLNKWNGALGVSKDETAFGQDFSPLGGQGSGGYHVTWTVGMAGCDLWNTITGVITHNGTLVGTMSDAAWNGPSCPGGSCGAKGSRGKIHDSNQPNASYTAMSVGANSYTYGTYNDGPFFWQKNTTTVVHCGVGEANWKSNHTYKSGDRIQPTANNPGNFIYQIIIDGIVNNSSAGPIVWNQQVNPVSDTTDGPLTWRNTGVGTAQEYFCDGHAWKGALGYGAGKKVTYHLYTNPASPQLALGPTITPAQVGDTHLGNTNANATDTNWIWVTSTDVAAIDILHGTIPSALYMENYLISPPVRFFGSYVPNCAFDAVTCTNGTLGQVRRAFHQYGSGWHKSFDVQNGISVISQTGKYAMLATDLMGQLGSTSNQAKCNVGARDWTKNDPTFHVGDLMFPNPQLGSTVGLNAGAYVFKVLNCTANGGNGSSCTTGTAKIASWPQGGTPGTVAITENAPGPGTITWTWAPDVNTPATAAQQNCRGDVVIVQLFRGSGPPPGATPVPATIMFTEKDPHEGRYSFDPDFSLGQLGGRK